MTLKAKEFQTANSAFTRRLARFRQDEDGGMIIFSLMLFVLILTFGGMAVDLMRFETTRAQLQATLDRASLAAADLDQTETAEFIVTDYMTKAGMIQFLELPVIVDQGFNYRKVTVNANAEMPLLFYDLPRVFLSPFVPGVSTLTVSGASTAEERITDVEVSVVVDISSSMRSIRKIGALRDAAEEFMIAMVPTPEDAVDAGEGLVTVSLVPYASTVSPEPLMGALLNVNRIHNRGTCLRFDDDTLFDQTTWDPNRTHEILGQFDMINAGRIVSPIDTPVCEEGQFNRVIPHSDNQAELVEAVQNLNTSLGTSIDQGMRWGVTLLDPSFQPVISQLAANPASSVPASAADRPAPYQDETMKVVVLMTDGRNSWLKDLKQRFRTELSFVWADLDYVGQDLSDLENRQTSVQYEGVETPWDPTDDMFFWNGRDRVRSYPHGYRDEDAYHDAMAAGPVIAEHEGIGPTYDDNVRRLHWHELFVTYEYGKVNDIVLRQANRAGYLPSSAGKVTRTAPNGDIVTTYLPDYTDTNSAIEYVRSGSRLDRSLSAICEAARNQGIIIYTVAFEAPSGGRAAMQDCASSPTHYFDVQGADISAAFASIASDIRALKLTQ